METNDQLTIQTQTEKSQFTDAGKQFLIYKKEGTKLTGIKKNEKGNVAVVKGMEKEEIETLYRLYVEGVRVPEIIGGIEKDVVIEWLEEAKFFDLYKNTTLQNADSKANQIHL